MRDDQHSGKQRKWLDYIVQWGEFGHYVSRREYYRFLVDGLTVEIDKDEDGHTCQAKPGVYVFMERGRLQMSRQPLGIVPPAPCRVANRGMK